MTAGVWSAVAGDWGMWNRDRLALGSVGELGLGCGCRHSVYWFACRITELDCPVVATTWLLIHRGFCFTEPELRRPSARPLGVGELSFFINQLLMPGGLGVGHGEGPTGTDRALE